MAAIFTAVGDIDKVIAERFKPGQTVNLIIGIPRDLTDDQIATFEKILNDKGVRLVSPIELGSTPDWQNALKVDLQAPDYHGVGVLPLAVLLVLAAGAIGIVAFLGISIVNTVRENMTFLIIAGAVVILGFAFITSRSPRPVEVSGEAGRFKAGYKG